MTYVMRIMTARFLRIFYYTIERLQPAVHIAGSLSSESLTIQCDCGELFGVAYFLWENR